MRMSTILRDLVHRRVLVQDEKCIKDGLMRSRVATYSHSQEANLADYCHGRPHEDFDGSGRVTCRV